MDEKDKKRKQEKMIFFANTLSVKEAIICFLCSVDLGKKLCAHSWALANM
jgi:hypothetical protein